MEPNFWLERWREGRIGFHRADVNPNLRALQALLPPPGSSVLVPLCGKTLDMAYLADLGHAVTGVELSPLAAHAFFEERGITPAQETVGPYTRWSADGVSILQGDFFSLADADVGPFDAVWDRAALIALPPPMRERYARTLGATLPAGAPYLLVTIDVPDREGGPPFSIDEATVRALFSADFEIRPQGLHRIDAPGDPFDGQHEGRYLLLRRP